MKTFAKEPKLAKFFSEAKVDIRAVLYNKKVHWFFHMSVMAKLLCFGFFAAG